jgi:ADP-heptose:LPS heptosyltransferase
MATAIRKAWPNAHVSFLATEYTKPIIERSAGVHEILILNEGLWNRIQLFRNAKAEVVFFPSPRFGLALAAFLARVPVRIGTGFRWYSFLFNKRVYEHRKTAEHHEAVYNLRMLAKIGLSPSYDDLPEITLQSDEITRIENWLKNKVLTGREKFAVLHVGSSGSSKEWPADRFAELGRLLVDRYNLSIILTGLSDDKERLQDLQRKIGESHAFLFVGASLPELAALLERAEIVVSNSTGPGHLAAALGTRSVGLFPLPPALSKERWGFRGPRVANISPPPLADCPNCNRGRSNVQCTCMERLEVGTVITNIDSLLEET